MGGVRVEILWELRWRWYEDSSQSTLSHGEAEGIVCKTALNLMKASVECKEVWSHKTVSGSRRTARETEGQTVWDTMWSHIEQCGMAQGMEEMVCGTE